MFGEGNIVTKYTNNGVAIGRGNKVDYETGNGVNNYYNLSGVQIALGNKAWVGRDLRFAIALSDTNASGTGSESSNQNKFVINKDGKVGIGASFSRSPRKFIRSSRRYKL